MATTLRTHEFEIKVGNTLPVLATTLQTGATRTPEPIDLTSAISVGLTMALHEHPKTKVIDMGSADFVADATGTVSYPWQPGDTDLAGLYDIEWTIVFPGGNVMTVPSCGFDKVRINPLAG